MHKDKYVGSIPKLIKVLNVGLLQWRNEGSSAIPQSGLHVPVIEGAATLQVPRSLHAQAPC